MGQQVRPMGWATGWATRLAHRVPMGIKTSPRPDPLASGLPMDFNNNGSGRPLVWWAVGFLGRTLGREQKVNPKNWDGN